MIFHRSPSPLAFCLGHHHPAGASQLTQSYTPNQNSNRSNEGPATTKTRSNSPKLQKANSFKSKSSDEKL